MSYQYFRFLLADKPYTIDDTRQFTAKIRARQSGGFVRAAFDIEGDEKSISILCKCRKKRANAKDTFAAQLEWFDYLKGQVPVKAAVEGLALEEEKTSIHSCCGVDHSSQPTQHKARTQQKHHHKHHRHSHGSHSHSCSHSHHGHHRHEEHGSYENHHTHDNHQLKATIGMIYGLGLLALSAAALPLSALSLFVLNGLSSVLTLYLGANLYHKAWELFKQGKVGSPTLYTISTLTILTLSVLSMIIPGIPMMLESAPLILGFWHLGEVIEHSLIDKINKNIDIRDSAPRVARVKNLDNKLTPVYKLIPNDEIIVPLGDDIPNGDVIPVDGVLKNPALIETTIDTGYGMPTHFEAGYPVKSGMRVVEAQGDVTVRVKKPYQKSHLSNIANDIQEASRQKAPLEQFAEQILRYFVPGLMATAMISGIALSILVGPALAIQSVTSLLVGCCPCVLGLITPLAIKLGMKKVTKAGVRIKNGEAVDAASRITDVVWDLHGTFSEGMPSVQQLRIDKENEKYLHHIAELESHSKHPVAKVIADYIRSKELTPEPKLEAKNIKNERYGISATINGEQFIIGNLQMLHAYGITSLSEGFSNSENGTTYIVRNSTVIGQILIEDKLRVDAVETIEQLKKMGIKSHLLTGADKIIAEKYAKKLKIPLENVRANAIGAKDTDNNSSPSKIKEMPKEDYIIELQKRGLIVAMVGDAQNDLSALTRADLGIAVKSSIGYAHTEAFAGMSVHKGTLFPIAIAFDIAKRTRQNIYQNLFISLSYNSIMTLAGAGLFISLGFTLSPGLSILCMLLESTIVLANLYRFKEQNTNIQLKTAANPTLKLNELLATPEHPRKVYEFESELELDLGLDNSANPLVNYFGQEKKPAPLLPLPGQTTATTSQLSSQNRI